VPIRRIFLLGAAAFASLAALVAIAAVLSGDFDETDGKIFGTLATAFVAGSIVVAGLACVARRTSPSLGAAGVVLACAGFVLWSAQIWGEYDNGRYIRLLGFVTAWTLAVLVATTTRLLTSSPKLLRTLYPATAAAAAGAAAVASLMLLRTKDDGWQAFAVLLILALLGEALTPIVERYAASDDRPRERLLGVVAGAEVVAVRMRDTRSVRIGDVSAQLMAGEGVVVRAKT
jgi:hypothetical protein